MDTFYELESVFTRGCMVMRILSSDLDSIEALIDLSLVAMCSDAQIKQSGGDLNTLKEIVDY